MTCREKLLALFKANTGRTTITPPAEAPGTDKVHGYQRSKNIVISDKDIFLRYWRPPKGRNGD